MRARTFLRAALILAVLVVGTWDLLVTTPPGRRLLVRLFDPAWAGAPANDPGPAAFDGEDAALPRIAATLLKVAGDTPQPTDLVVVAPGRALLASKQGDLLCLDLASGATSVFAHVDVAHHSELGLLGLATHPDWPTDPRLYVSRTVEGGTAALSQVVVHRLDHPTDPCAGGWSAPTVLIEVDQPYANHDGGQIRFGADRKLYWGLGDGGFRNDPLGAGQDLGTLLGKLLRLDVTGDRATAPADNPFIGRPGARPEIWAWGLRNPWRFDLLPDGRALVGDVGQDRWEEVDVVRAGDNLGWNVREGDACLGSDDPTSCAGGFVAPAWVYGRDRGVSVTGGVVGRGGDALDGLFVFGDFATGRLWALDPATRGVMALGRWNVRPSAFARDDHGRVLLLDFNGAVWRLAPASVATGEAT